MRESIFSQHFNKMKDGDGVNKREELLEAILENDVRHRSLETILETEQFNNMLQGCFLKIRNNLESILDKCRGGKTKQTIEGIIPLAQEINIIFDFINDITMVWAARPMEKSTKQRSK